MAKCRGGEIVGHAGVADDVAVRNNKSTSAAKSPASHPRDLWILIGIIVVGVLFRAPRLTESLWYDEIASWQVYCANAASPLAIMGNFNDPINHVLSNVLVWCSVSALNASLQMEIAFRLPALVFSLLSIIAMFGLGQAAGGRRVGFVAAGLMSVLPVAVLEGNEARGYSMMIFFAAAGTWTLVTVLSRQRPRIAWWMLYSILCALGVWSHFVAAFVPIGHAAWLIWRGFRSHKWRDFAQGLIAQSIAAAMAIALYLPMLPVMMKSRGMFIALHPDQPRIFGTEGLHAFLQLGGSWYWWAAMPGLIIGCMGMIAVIQQRSSESKACCTVSGGGVVAAAMLGLPIMLLVVAISGAWVYARFTLFALPGAMLLIALGIDLLWSGRRAMGAAAIVVMASASIADLAARPPKQSIREAMDLIRENQTQGDVVLVVGLAHPVALLYADDIQMTYTMRHGAELPARLAELHPRWLVIEYPRHVKPATFDLIRSAGFIEQKRLPGWVDWGNGEIIVLRRP